MTFQQIVEPTYEDMSRIVREQDSGKLTLVNFGNNGLCTHIVFGDGPICKCRGRRLVPA